MRTGIKSTYISYAVKGNPFAIVAKFKCNSAQEVKAVLSKCFTVYPASKYRMTQETYKF